MNTVCRWAWRRKYSLLTYILPWKTRAFRVLSISGGVFWRWWTHAAKTHTPWINFSFSGVTMCIVNGIIVGIAYIRNYFALIKSATVQTLMKMLNIIEPRMQPWTAPNFAICNALPLFTILFASTVVKPTGRNTIHSYHSIFVTRLPGPHNHTF